MGFGYYTGYVDFSDIVGHTFDTVTSADDTVTFWKGDGPGSYMLRHDQDCCESVYVDEIIGDLNDLAGTPILAADLVTNENVDHKDEYDDSCTWSFYNVRTIKGSVTIRFYGASNGYYSETVSCVAWTED